MVGGTIVRMTLWWSYSWTKRRVIYEIIVRGTGTEKNDLLAVCVDREGRKQLRLHDRCWWQGSRLYFGRDGDPKEHIVERYGFSHEPRTKRWWIL